MGGQIEGVLCDGVKISLLPSKVKGFKVRIGSSKIYLSWKRNKAVAGYQIERMVHVNIKGFTSRYFSLKTIKKNKTTRLKNIRLVRGMKYSYRIRTYVTAGKKKISSEWVYIKKKKCH